MAGRIHVDLTCHTVHSATTYRHVVCTTTTSATGLLRSSSSSGTVSSSCTHAVSAGSTATTGRGKEGQGLFVYLSCDFVLLLVVWGDVRMLFGLL
ncbi:predicted protein [Plenodomus lingam JN3]|uniref:Predicted protein n=1 Tax=Leptosphaeria maculans (strain JN3 / isolate v23.1.3 / race Av1-4-5-6-7-8) TaxID=985895 RepID=E5A1V6_LEPMJ|nr:predicted protein [Plenodomus lingam JN3]CBX97673.1 predicted protein [Plenodomus lingam JN3]